MKTDAATTAVKTRKEDVVDELHRPARKNFTRRHTVIRGYNELMQSDLIDMQNYAKINKGYKYILIVIDAFSKYLHARPLKSKSGIVVANAMSDILENLRVYPKHVQTDAGTEYFNVHFKKLMNKHNINHYSTFSKTKAAIAERVIRTIKSWLYKKFSLQGNHKWINILESTVNTYNSRKHRTINMRPIDVTPTTKLNVFKQMAERSGKKAFNKGDIVRISKFKSLFDKGYNLNWTTELFRIARVHSTRPVTYILEDLEKNPIKGSFYREELQKSKHVDIYLIEKVLRRKGNQIYVKWLGFPSSKNSWINENAFVK